MTTIPAKVMQVRLLDTFIYLRLTCVRPQGLKQLGATSASGPGDCTHVVMKNLQRSEKLLCAMPVARYIVTEKWAIECAKARRLLRMFLNTQVVQNTEL